MIEDIRYLVTEHQEWRGATRGGSPVAGGHSRRVTVTRETLQIKINGEWRNIRREHEPEEDEVEP